MPLSTAGFTTAQLEAVGHGSYLVNAVADCNGCHTANPAKFLAGGALFGGPGAPFTVVSRNLTPDATTGLPSDINTVDQFVAALRTGADWHGVASGGTPGATLVVMPWPKLRWLSTGDIRAIYAYLQVIPAVSNAIPADTKTTGAPLAAATAYGDGDQTTATPLPAETDVTGSAANDPDQTLRGLAINPITAVTPPSDPEMMARFGRGSYIVNSGALCIECHTNAPTVSPSSTKINTANFLTGGRVFATPPPLQPIVKTVRSASANLSGKANGFFNQSAVTFATFLTLITHGVHAEDPPPQQPVAWPMPWQQFSNMTLDDLEAVYTYVSAVSTQYGKTSLTGAADKVVRASALYCDATNACPPGMACSSSTAPGECLKASCAADADCALCQSCASNACAAVTGGALAGCVATGY